MARMFQGDSNFVIVRLTNFKGSSSSNICFRLTPK